MAGGIKLRGDICVRYKSQLGEFLIVVGVEVKDAQVQFDAAKLLRGIGADRGTMRFRTEQRPDGQITAAEIRGWGFSKKVEDLITQTLGLELFDLLTRSLFFPISFDWVNVRGIHLPFGEDLLHPPTPRAPRTVEVVRSNLL